VYDAPTMGLGPQFDLRSRPYDHDRGDAMITVHPHGRAGQVTGPPPYTVISTMITLYATGSTGAGRDAVDVHGDQQRWHELELAIRSEPGQPLT
jgi:hypothetical protein